MFPGYFADDILKVVFEQNNFISVQISTALVCFIGSDGQYFSIGTLTSCNLIQCWPSIMISQSLYEYELNINLYIFVSTVWCASTSECKCIYVCMCVPVCRRCELHGYFPVVVICVNDHCQVNINTINSSRCLILSGQCHSHLFTGDAWNECRSLLDDVSRKQKSDVQRVIHIQVWT